MECAKNKSLRIEYHMIHLLQLAVIVQWIGNLKFMEIVIGCLLGLVCPEAIGDQGRTFLTVLAAVTFNRFALKLGMITYCGMPSEVPETAIRTTNPVIYFTETLCRSALSQLSVVQFLQKSNYQIVSDTSLELSDTIG